MRRPGRRPACQLLLVLVLLLAAPAAAFAGADDAGPGAAKPATGSSLTALEDRLMASPDARWALLLGRIVPIGVGIGLLIALYLKRERRRAGLIPPRPPVVLSTPVDIGPAWGLALLAMLVVPTVVLWAIFGRDGMAGASITWKVVASASGSLPLAALVGLRRRRLRRRAPEAAAEAVFGEAGPQAAPQEARAGLLGPTRPPGLGRAVGLGWWAFCVAAVAVTPLGLVWAMVLSALGHMPHEQELVMRVVNTPVAHEPWLIVGFGVFVAPFVEESIFRGLLYPATRRALGGGTRGAWGAAVIVSGIFAAIHTNWLALVPLFALAMVLAWIFERTNSLAACVFAHATHNAISLLPLMLLRYG
jgi:membrane protease YdiL (CAAX protease family)